MLVVAPQEPVAPERARVPGQLRGHPEEIAQGEHEQEWV